VPEGFGELNERDGVDGVEGVVVEGFGAENERDGVLGVVTFGVEGFGVENDRLLPDFTPDDFGLENDLLLAAHAGVATTPSKKTIVTTRARTRRTQAQGRMVPLPSEINLPVAEIQVGLGKFLLTGSR
jgi:hypothetical protein